MKINPSLSGNISRGLVQVFTGDGKGKTSAAVGTIVRALSHGLRVCAVLFLKGNFPSGEWSFLSSHPNIQIKRFGTGSFCNPSDIKPEDRAQALAALKCAEEAVFSGTYDLVVLDEINVAIGWQLIPLENVVKLIEGKPSNVELILTGRRADPEIVKRADLVTEMLKIKHPFDAGIPAREGFEY